MGFETIILGAGAAGLYCAGDTGAGTLVIDHAAKPGEKIRISGGGRCNFTNTRTTAAHFLSQNRHFAKSALGRHTPADFIKLVRDRGIAFHEKTLGQLFCDDTAKDIVALLVDRATRAGAEIRLGTAVVAVERAEGGFAVTLERDGRQYRETARRLVVATGGKSIPKMGATGLAYRIAADFGLEVTETRPGLVPFTFDAGRFAALAGIALPVRASAGGVSFDEALLFTHRGLSGPAMLQISSFWREGEAIAIDLLPGIDALAALRTERAATPKRAITTVLARLLPARLADHLAAEGFDTEGQIGTASDKRLTALADRLHDWRLTPTGTEGYRTAEVTLGGVSTKDLDSKTMQAKAVPGLYFIGECVDVTGWLGGYNFQWAWASAHAAAQAIKAA